VQSCYPATKWIRSAVPTFEPVELSRAKRQCSLPVEASYDHHDELLNDLIKTARETVERDASLALCTGTYTRKFTEFGWRDWFELADLKPITSITSITYVDTTGTTQTWDAANYSLDVYGVAPSVLLAYDSIWPTLRGDVNGITMTAVAGYATQALIPMRAKQAVLMLVGHWFIHRETVLTGTISKDIEFSYTSLIESLRREVYG
jgi:uncharacterized phiE125 gp8 family phage protein